MSSTVSGLSRAFTLAGDTGDANQVIRFVGMVGTYFSVNQLCGPVLRFDENSLVTKDNAHRISIALCGFTLARGSAAAPAAS